jgi:phage tail-like protein
MNALEQPVLAFNFTVTLWDAQGPHVGSTVRAAVGQLAGQLIFGSFAEVSGLDVELEVEAYQEGGRNDGALRFAKPAKFPNLVFRRGITARTDLWDWQAQVIAGEETAIRKSGLIVLFDRNGASVSIPRVAATVSVARVPVAAWRFERGLPVKLQGPTLDAKSNTVAIERLEIAHERLERVSLTSIPGLGDIASQVPSFT